MHSYRVYFYRHYHDIEMYWEGYYKALERIKKLRDSWKYATVPCWKPFYIAKVVPIFRKTMLSISGWIARKGYHKKRGK